MIPQYDTIIKELEVICGCTRTAQNAAAAMRELIAQRGVLLESLKTIQFTAPCSYSKNIASAAIAAVEGGATC